ncbi:MAG: hypothetical protein ACTHU0_21520 [Kofleriaceae bacterium]
MRGFVQRVMRAVAVHRENDWLRGEVVRLTIKCAAARATLTSEGVGGRELLDALARTLGREATTVEDALDEVRDLRRRSVPEAQAERSPEELHPKEACEWVGEAEGGRAGHRPLQAWVRLLNGRVDVAVRGPRGTPWMPPEPGEELDALRGFARAVLSRKP